MSSIHLGTLVFINFVEHILCVAAAYSATAKSTHAYITAVGAYSYNNNNNNIIL